MQDRKRGKQREQIPSNMELKPQGEDSMKYESRKKT